MQFFCNDQDGFQVPLVRIRGFRILCLLGGSGVVIRFEVLGCFQVAAQGDVLGSDTELACFLNGPTSALNGLGV